MKTSGEGSLTKVPERKPTSMVEYLESVAPRMQQYLPKGMNADRFMRIAMRAFIQNPALARCEKASVVIAIGQAAELGLEPNGALGLAALVPYKNKAKLLVMYKGSLQLMYRTEKFAVITADEVCENDIFEYEKGLNARLKHVPALRDRGKPWAYYAYYKTKDGGFDFQVMSREEAIEWGKQYSRAYAEPDSPWQTAEAEMCKKTVIRKLAKYCPVAVDIPSEDFDAPDLDAGRFQALIQEDLEARTVEVEQKKEAKKEATVGKESKEEADTRGAGAKAGTSQPEEKGDKAEKDSPPKPLNPPPAAGGGTPATESSPRTGQSATPDLVLSADQKAAKAEAEKAAATVRPGTRKTAAELFRHKPREDEKPPANRTVDFQRGTIQDPPPDEDGGLF